MSRKGPGGRMQERTQQDNTVAGGNAVGTILGTFAERWVSSAKYCFRQWYWEWENDLCHRSILDLCLQGREFWNAVGH